LNGLNCSQRLPDEKKNSYNKRTYLKYSKNTVLYDKQENSTMILYRHLSNLFVVVIQMELCIASPNDWRRWRCKIHSPKNAILSSEDMGKRKILATFIMHNNTFQAVATIAIQRKLFWVIVQCIRHTPKE
jgi:hypothetical protein